MRPDPEASLQPEQTDLPTLPMPGAKGARDQTSSPSPEPTAATQSRGSELAYAQAFEGVDLTYNLLPEGLKETLVLEHARTASRYRFILTPPEDRDLRFEEEADGSWSFFLSSHPGTAFRIAAPYAFDSSSTAQSVSDDPHVSMNVTRTGKAVAVDVSVDAEWLHDPARAFPVYVDPTTIFTDEYDGSITATCSTCKLMSKDRLFVATNSTNAFRAALQFDLQAIPEASHIVGSQLQLYHDNTCLGGSGGVVDCGTAAHQIDAHSMSKPWTTLSLTSDIGFDPTALSSTNVDSGLGPRWWSWGVGQAVRKWVTGAEPNFGLMVKLSSEALGKGGPMFPSNTFATYSLRPKLEVTWDDSVQLFPPDTLHADGAELRWTRYTGSSGVPFEKYEVHRSGTANFTPSEATLLTTIRDVSVSSYRDTTAAPAKAFTYKIVTNGTSSFEQTVTLPPVGRTTKLIRPAAAPGKATQLDYMSDQIPNCYNYGRGHVMYVGQSTVEIWRPLVSFDVREIPSNAVIEDAKMSLWRPYNWTSDSPTTTNVHRITRAWSEGTGSASCSGDGSTWYEHDGVRKWTTEGGDFDSAVAGSDSSATDEKPAWDEFTITDLVGRWARGEVPNHGVLVKIADDKLQVPSTNTAYYTDDQTVSPALRPKLTVTYVDGSKPLSPVVSINSPAKDSKVSGAGVRVSAAASDDRRVENVQFFAGSTAIGTDGTQPFETTWDSTKVTNGIQSLTAVATDDAGNSTTSEAIPVEVQNSAAPTASVTSPRANSSVKGSVTVSGSVADDKALDRVEFYFDGIRIGDPLPAPAGATTWEPSITWATLDARQPAYDGVHSLTVKAYDNHGQATTSAPVSVTVGNAAGTKYLASFSTTAVPPTMKYDPAATTQQSYGVDVTVTNQSSTTWSASDIFLRYRWVDANGQVVATGPEVSLGTDLAKNKAKLLPKVLVEPPTLPDGVDRAQYTLRFDMFERSSASYFAAKGNRPLENPVIITKILRTALGIERYYHYDGEELGAGMNHLVNVANGNSLLSWTPFMAPGRGLSTVMDVTYNSLEDRSESPLGNNFSLSLSSLTRFGLPLDIHPNKADEIAGRSKKWIEFTDGDGTTHRFDQNSAGGWDEPPGVHLYLREFSTTDPTRKWAITRPDRVTFFFDSDGYPTGVEDKNGNRLAFALEDVAPGDDPGGLKKRIVSVTDAAGLGSSPAANRKFNVDYYTKDEVKKPQIRGRIEKITDHTGSAISFDYYEDGNLLRITQRGGRKADGSYLADRTYVLTYTTSDGSGPAIAAAGDRLNPDPKTPNQSSRLYSVRDPRGAETTFAYYGPTSSQNRWKLKSRTNRVGSTTAFAYDNTTRTTTVTAPLSRISKYTYDTDGSVVTITNPKDETTTLAWSGDRHLTKITEPTGKYSEFAYNENGYVTDQWDQLRNHISITYENLSVDANDITATWKTGRTVPHISQLKSKIDGRGSVWTFDHDAKGNLIKVSEPEGVPAYSTQYVYNSDGTLASRTDANGHTTNFPSYDANGYATKVVDAKSQTTTFGYDDDGLLRWIQDPLHASYGAGDPREFRTYFDYDDFHRLGRESSPKSTEYERGKLIWSSAEYDANDNLVRALDPDYAAGAGAPWTVDYDAMDRPLRITGPDISVDGAGEPTELSYDAAGRVTKVTSPKGVGTTSEKDFTMFFDYDLLDRVLRETRHNFDSSGAVSETFTTHSCYDLAGDLRSVTAPKAAVATVNCGAPPSHTTTFDYDAAHRLLSETDALGHKRSMTYDANGNVVTTTNENGDKTTVVYDKKDQPEKVIEPFMGGLTARDVTTKYVYDPVGNLKQLVSPRAWDASATKSGFSEYVTTYHYDALNRMTKVALPTSAASPQQHFIHQAHDPNGNLAWSSLATTAADPSSLTSSDKTQMSYFDAGWIRSLDDPTPAAKVNFDYTAQGWQSVRYPENRRETESILWTYYLDGQLKEEKDESGQPTTYTYDANNNLTAIADASGLTGLEQKGFDIEMLYDGVDRLLKVRDRKQGGSGNFSVSTFGYDLNDNLNQVVDNQEETAAGEVVKAGHKQEFTYDAADWIDLQFDYGTDPGCQDNQRIDNAFTNTGWESARTISHRKATCDSETQASWELKQKTDWTYFLNGKLKSLTTRSGDGTIMESHDVSYVDAGIYVNGHRTKDVFTRKTPVQGSDCSTSSCTAVYTYDARDRLVKEDNGHGETTTYELDAVGNILSEAQNGSTTTTYAYDQSQLVSATENGITSRYFYDIEGNLDCVTSGAGAKSDCQVGATPSANLIADYTYDYLNRLTAYRSFAAGAKDDDATYAYDALDRLSSQTESHSGATAKRTTLFSYLGLSDWVTKEEHKDVATGSLLTTKSYTYDSYGNRISMTEDKANLAKQTYTYGYDVHGSVSLLLDKTGAAKASYGYTAYGAEDKGLTKGDTDMDDPLNAYRYSGERWDSGSGSIDMGARRFGPDISRFLEVDYFNGALDDLELSIDPLTQNRYSLAGGNPISFIEWDGHRVVADGTARAIRRPKRKSRSSSGGSGASSGGGSAADFRRAEEQSERDYRARSTDMIRPMDREAKQRRDEMAEKERVRDAVDRLDKNVGVAGALVGAGRDLSKRASKAGKTLNEVKRGLVTDPGQASEAGRRLSEFSRSKTATGISRFFKGRAGRILGRGVAGANLGLSLANNLGEGEGVGTAVTETGIEVGLAAGGAKIGFTVGCGAGPLGCFLGGAVGGAVGGLAGSDFGEAVGDTVADFVSDLF